MSRLKRFLYEPLLHFLAAGGILFAAYQLIQDPKTTAADEDIIVVDRSKLLEFMQYQSKTFEPKFFNARFDAMSDQQKKELIDQYVPEEALYREARAMGLAQGDYLIRRRLVQKMLYLLDDTVTESFSPTEEQLRDYYLKHKERYEVAPSLTFTHVFIDGEIKHSDSTEKVAERLKGELEAKRAGYNDAPAYGDRFPYLQNYVDRDPEFIQHQLGAAFASTVMKLKPSDHVWYGPIKSQFGYHLVLLTRHKPAYLPELEAIHQQVQDDLLRDTIDAYRDRAVADLVSRFKVKLSGISLRSGLQPTADAKHPAL